MPLCSRNFLSNTHIFLIYPALGHHKERSKVKQSSFFPFFIGTLYYDLTNKSYICMSSFPYKNTIA